MQREITQAIASVQARPIALSKQDTAVTEERKGFLFLVTSDVAKARDAFLAAYEAFPTYHNVDEISHRVLTAERIAFYARATPPKRAAVLRNVIGGTLSTYSWGIPTDLLPKLKARAT